MSEEREENRLQIRRILVALDTSTDSLVALRAAARMAAALDAEVVGLFVEDINLLRLANLPFGGEILRLTGVHRPLSQAQVERDLQLLASQARRALAEAAAEAQIAWSFRVVRGVVKREVVKAALEVDLLSLGRTSRPLLRQLKMGSTAREAVRQAPHSVFIGIHTQEAGEPIFVTYDGSPTADKAVIAAENIAEINDVSLVVVLIRHPEEPNALSAGELADRVEEILDARRSKVDIDYRDLTREHGQRLIEAAQNADCSLLVLGGETPLLRGEALQLLLDELSCPVMLVR